MTAQVAADLRAAADVLRRDGWTQESYFDDRRRCCQAGALLRMLDLRANRSGDLSDADLRRWLAAQEAMDSYLSKDGHAGRAIEWNDHPSRTADEVIAALLAAADAAEADQ